MYLNLSQVKYILWDPKDTMPYTGKVFSNGFCIDSFEINDPGDIRNALREFADSQAEWNLGIKYEIEFEERSEVEKFVRCFEEHLASGGNAADFSFVGLLSFRYEDAGYVYNRWMSVTESSLHEKVIKREWKRMPRD